MCRRNSSQALSPTLSPSGERETDGRGHGRSSATLTLTENQPVSKRAIAVTTAASVPDSPLIAALALLGALVLLRFQAWRAVLCVAPQSVRVELETPADVTEVPGELEDAWGELQEAGLHAAGSAQREEPAGARAPLSRRGAPHPARGGVVDRRPRRAGAPLLRHPVRARLRHHRELPPPLARSARRLPRGRPGRRHARARCSKRTCAACRKSARPGRSRPSKIASPPPATGIRDRENLSCVNSMQLDCCGRWAHLAWWAPRCSGSSPDGRRQKPK